jgi:hypothetical protein
MIIQTILEERLKEDESPDDEDELGIIHAKLEEEICLLTTLIGKAAKLLRRNFTAIRLITMIDMQLDEIDFAWILNRPYASKEMSKNFV